MLRNILLSIFNHRTLALLRWDFHFLKVRMGNVLFRRNQKLARLLTRLTNPCYLNLGSGPRGLADGKWLNVDGFNDLNVHFTMDFTKPFPFPNDSFDGIFCEHVFEHFTLDSGQLLLQECLRVLKPGSILRLIMPDGEKVIKTYIQDPLELLKIRPVDSHCAMEAVNTWCYQRYEHQTLYDAKLLEFQLHRAGFNKVAGCEFGNSSSGMALVLDDPKYQWESIYMEGTKPLSFS